MSFSPHLPALPAWDLNFSCDTVPNTPLPDSEFDTNIEFATLVPLNKRAKTAVQYAAQHASSFHRSFIQHRSINGKPVSCFVFALGHLPDHPNLGWRIGRGRKNLDNHGVELLLGGMAREDDVHGIHARFHFHKQAGGFFVSNDHHDSDSVLLVGQPVTGRRVIPKENTILLGECAFTLRYTSFSTEEEESYELELRRFMARFHDDENPFIVPTPSGNEAAFGDWNVQWAIARGTYGTVYAVTHAKSGKYAAAKHLLQNSSNERHVRNEIKMTKKIMGLPNPRIATPSEIIRQDTRSKVDIVSTAT